MPIKSERRELDPRVLKPNPWNSNVVGPEMEVRLENSMRALGCYKDIVVRELADGSHQILGGQHRCETAIRLGFELVPVTILKDVDEKTAKKIGLIDNGRYGEDDAVKLAEILRDLGEVEVMEFLPFTPHDLAGIYAADDIDLDKIGIDDDDETDMDLGEATKERAAVTHALMNFKVPIEDQGTVERYFAHVVKKQGLGSERDSKLAAGLALVAIVNAAQEVL